MSVSAHDRISGTPQMVRAWNAFLRHVKEKPGVAFPGKDAIARCVLNSPLTLRDIETIRAEMRSRPPALGAWFHRGSE